MATPIEIAVRTTGASAARSQLRGVRGEVTGLGASTRRLAVGGAAALGLTSLVRGVVGLGASSVKTEAQFSTTMRLLAAATKAPRDELAELNKLAIDLGASTSFSANEAADAMLELGKAGLDTKTIIGGGVAGTLTLAAAGGLELEAAATIASNALNAFNLEGRDMARVAAALAGGANASSASVESLGQGLSQVSAGAVNAGLSLNDTVGALSLFDAAGIKGSDAGTSLKTMLTRLVPSTAKAAEEAKRLGLDFTDAQGRILPLTEVAAELQRELSGLTQEQRTTALATVFGSDATRAASVLMRAGASGVRDYVKATKDQNAAQEMAKARMEGTTGSLERLSGVVETAKLRIGQELSGAVQGGAGVLERNLIPALEGAIDTGKEFGEAISPAVSAVVDLFRELAPEVSGLAGLWSSTLLPAISGGADLLRGAVDLFQALPEPLRDLAGAAVAAALIMPRLSSAASSAGASVVGSFATMSAKARQLGAEMTYAETRTQRLGQAARGAAGLGGILALQAASSTSSDALQGLASVGGGALLGFAAGGPIGAAVGGTVGALQLLISKSSDTSDALTDARPPAKDYAASLDQVTGAATRATRELVYLSLAERGAFTAATALGLSNRDLVDASLGVESAQRRVSRAVEEGEKKYAAMIRRGDGTTDAAGNLSRALGKVRFETAEVGREVDKASQGIRDMSAATKPLGELLKGLPKDVRPYIKTQGVPQSIGELQRLQARFKLNPKEVRTLVRTLGVDPAVREVLRFRDGMVQGINAADRAADGGMRVVQGTLIQRTGEAARAAAGTARSGATSIGTALAAGAAAGVRASAAQVANEAASMVINALARARHEAKIKSPSRATREIGEQLGEGMARGVESKGERNDRAMSDLVRSMLKAAESGAGDLARTVRDRLDKGLSGDALGRGVKATRDEVRALQAKVDQLNRVTRALDKQRDKLRELVNESKAYARAIREGIVESGNVTGLERPEGEGLTPASMLDQLKAQLRDAQRFADLVRKLKRDGINATTLDQILQAGVSGGGLEAAETLAAGGQAVIDEVNAITAELEAVGGQIGRTGADAMYGAGIEAAEGLIRGLKARQGKLDRIAERLGRELAQAVRRALGINSPSRVFAGIGQQTVDGLRIGLDDDRVRRYGEVLASSLREGFARPELTARAAWDAAAADGFGGAVAVELTAEQLSLLEQGRRVQVALDYARARGVRGATF